MSDRHALISRKLRRFAGLEARAQKAINRLAASRFAVFALGVFALASAVDGDFRLQGALGTLGCGLLFLWLMVRHDRTYRFVERCRVAQVMCQNDIHRLERRLQDVHEPGPPPEFPPQHPFAHDLGFVGEQSLFKLLDHTVHPAARTRLMAWMDQNGPVEEIQARQEAVTELADKTLLRWRWGVEARAGGETRDLDTRWARWMDLAAPVTLRPWLFWPLQALAVFSAGCLFLGVFTSTAPSWWPLPVALQFLAFSCTAQIQKRFLGHFMVMGEPLAGMARMLQQMAGRDYSCSTLRAIQAGFDQPSAAAPALTQLLRAHQASGYRVNGLLFFLFNFLIQRDMHLARSLSAWRRQHGHRLLPWLDHLSYLEALASLAHFAWLFPAFQFPRFCSHRFPRFRATALGHPLIPADRRVCNDYALPERGAIHLLTGSNMSGKSTFLRTVGVNWVLARLGVPVCAKELVCNLSLIWTSIYIQDSLAQGVSHFYAEVKRLKAILDAVRRSDQPVFFLMDEILRGTNSRERLIACKALVRELARHDVCGIVTTHDLELLALTTDFPDRIANYHFREVIRDGQMAFEYRLRPHALSSTNALRVMRMAGLDLDFEGESTPPLCDPQDGAEAGRHASNTDPDISAATKSSSERVGEPEFKGGLPAHGDAKPGGLG